MAAITSTLLFFYHLSSSYFISEPGSVVYNQKHYFPIQQRVVPLSFIIKGLQILSCASTAPLFCSLSLASPSSKISKLTLFTTDIMMGRLRCLA
ncbi:unnamed protein product [Cuscuta campestris]|uniref:Uncharacterized protein n=1 Tax=Cuscuta campestris TaxID=132261 RepID=A0A484LGW6_9ASTE|nr:unnamed protein product [Cuscuta campestris]